MRIIPSKSGDFKMSLSKQTLETILAFKKQLENNYEPNGRYCLYNYHFNNSIEFANDSSGLYYIKNSRTGDHVSECIIQNNVHTDKRKIIWTEKIASVEENSPAMTEGLPNILQSGECICLFKELNTGTPEKTNLCYVVDKYVTIPENHIGLVQHSTSDKVGYIVVVPSRN